MKKSIVFQGPVSSRSGYGDHSRDLLKSLIEMDRYTIKIVDLRWGDCPRNGILEKDNHLKSLIVNPSSITERPDIFIQVSVPNEFRPIGKYNIGITAGIETDVCSAPWIEGLNRMDLNIVPSKHSKKVFENTVFDKMDQKTQQKVAEVRCVKPVEVLFEGLNLDVFSKTEKDSSKKSIDEQMKLIKEKFCFLYCGHWLNGALGHDRKDTGMTLKTFIETFKNNPTSTRPALIMKTSSATFSVTDRETILHNIKRLRQQYGKNCPNIYLLHGDLTDDEMNSLYNHPKIKAMVSFTHGEGFGRPLLEFSVTGKPVIAPNWSGHIDFLTPHSILLPGEVKPVHQSVIWKDVILEGSKWHYVNYGYASKVLKQVFKNYKSFLDNSRKQAHLSRENFSLSAMTTEFKRIIDSYMVEKVDIKLPKLQKLNKPPKVKLPKLKKITS